MAHFRTKDLTNAYALQTTLNHSFEEKGLLCYFRAEELFILNSMLDDEMRQSQEIVKKKLIATAGYQDGEPPLYFLNPEQIVNLNTGELVDPELLPMIWLPNWSSSCATFPRGELCHVIRVPVSIQPFQTFLDNARTILANNFPAAVLAWSAMIMMFRYSWTLKHIRHFNLPILYGVSSVGKTLVATCGAWLCGCLETQISSRCTLPFLIQKLTTSSMPLVWDDPTNPEEVGQLAVDLGNGAVRGKVSEMPLVPLTGCLVTANFDLSAVARYYSRICVIKMDHVTGPKQPGSARKLEDKAAEASAALPLLLHTMETITPEEVHECTRRLNERMPCDLRLVEGLAVPLTVARKVLQCADRTNYMDDIEGYLDNVLVPYITETLPSNNNCGNVILEKILQASQLQISASVECKDGSVRVMRSFLFDIGLKENTLAMIKRDRIGESTKVVRMRGSLRRTTVINCSAIRDDLLQRLMSVLSNPEENILESDTESIAEEEMEQPRGIDRVFINRDIVPGACETVRGVLSSESESDSSSEEEIEEPIKKKGKFQREIVEDTRPVIRGPLRRGRCSRSKLRLTRSGRKF